MPTKTKPDTATISDDAIRQRAYYLWEADGRPEGRADHYWYLANVEATRMLAAEPAKPARSKAVKAAPAEKPAAKPAKTAAKPAAAKTPRRAAPPA